MPGKAVFLDTGFAIALASPRDRYHAKSAQLADDLKTSGSAIITTRAVQAALAADIHFQQAGFKELLLET